MPAEFADHSGPIVYKPIGVVRNSFRERGAPKELRNSTSTLVIDPRFLPALNGLEHFKHLVVIYHLHHAAGYQETVHPMGDRSIARRGVLATRSPCRPNPLGITVVEILRIDNGHIEVTGLDALDGTPILDIKPYDEHFDSPEGLVRERHPCYRPEDPLSSRQSQSRR